MVPLLPAMRADALRHRGAIRYDIDWVSRGEYLDKLERRGAIPNVAAIAGGGTVQVNVLRENNVTPTPEQVGPVRRLVQRTTEDGALGVTTALL